MTVSDVYNLVYVSVSVGLLLLSMIFGALSIFALVSGGMHND